jgi:hypothetical protein
MLLGERYSTFTSRRSCSRFNIGVTNRMVEAEKDLTVVKESIDESVNELLDLLREFDRLLISLGTAQLPAPDPE